MKPEGSVRHKLKQVRFRYLKKELEQSLAVCSKNCMWNQTVSVGTTSVGMCGHGKFARTLCDDKSFDGANPSECHEYKSRISKAEVKDAFYGQLNNATLPEIAYRYPDMAALLWVLSEDDDVPEHDPEEFIITTPTKTVYVEVQKPQPVQPVQPFMNSKPWWYRLLWWLT